MIELQYYGSPNLRADNLDVDKINAELRDTIKSMKSVMNKSNGIGLAAPQAGINSRFFITEVSGDEFRAFINPKIISTSVTEVEIEEGCLSVPGVYENIVRPEKVVIEFFDNHGIQQRLKASGMLARVILHEFDHLNGVLFIDFLDKKHLHKIEKKIEHKLRHRRNQ